METKLALQVRPRPHCEPTSTPDVEFSRTWTSTSTSALLVSSPATTSLSSSYLLLLKPLSGSFASHPHPPTTLQSPVNLLLVAAFKGNSMKGFPEMKIRRGKKKTKQQSCEVTRLVVSTPRVCAFSSPSWCRRWCEALQIYFRFRLG